MLSVLTVASPYSSLMSCFVSLSWNCCVELRALRKHPSVHDEIPTLYCIYFIIIGDKMCCNSESLKFCISPIA